MFSIGVRMKTLPHCFPRRLFSLSVFLSIAMNGLGAQAVFNVLDYGAHNDGSASSTEAINSAIRAAGAAGGGTVCIPPGDYVTGPIELTNDLVLEIEAGATLRFPARRLPFTQGPRAGHRMSHAGPADWRTAFA